MATGVSGPILLWVSVLIFAASSSVIRVLSDLGAAHAGGGDNPITFCNLLFAGNACAVLVLIPLYWRDWRRDALAQMSAADWLGLTALALLTSALALSFYFLALENTMVTSVVLLAQLEPPLVLLLSWLFLVGGQVAWLAGMKNARALDISLATSFAPVAGVLAAFTILGERPMAAHLVGGAVLMIGIAVGLLGSRTAPDADRRVSDEPTPNDLQVAERGARFKGV